MARGLALQATLLVGGVLVARLLGINAAHFRQTDVDELCGAPPKRAAAPGWQPRVGFTEFLWITVEAHLGDAGLDPGQYTVTEAAI
jgi:hypothetical protein